MKTIYLDSNFHCHTQNVPGYTPVNTDVFDNMPDPVIECYIFIPAKDGKADFIQAFRSVEEIERAQWQYERPLLAEYESALAEIEAALGV